MAAFTTPASSAAVPFEPVDPSGQVGLPPASMFELPSRPAGASGAWAESLGPSGASARGTRPKAAVTTKQANLATRRTEWARCLLAMGIPNLSRLATRVARGIQAGGPLVALGMQVPWAHMAVYTVIEARVGWAKPLRREMMTNGQPRRMAHRHGPW